MKLPSLFAAALASALLSMPFTARAATRYVFATFLGDDASKEKLSIYTSKNGSDFTLLSNTGYAGPTGVLRDPSIMKHSDGLYYIAYTLKSWTTTSASFAIASSPDLKTWTFRSEVPAQVTGVKDTWAPEWFKDTDGIHLIVSIDTSTTQFKSYLYTASDATLTKWDAPVPLGIGPNYIDTFVVKIGAGYHAFTKNETTKYIEHATASALTGPWTFVGKDNWAGWGSGKEGPALFQLESGQWRLLMDCYGNCGFLQATSTDLNTWSSTSTVPVLSGVVRHGTVLREDDTAGGSGGMSGSGGASTGNAGRGGAGGSSGATPDAGGRAGASGGSPNGAGTSNAGGAGNGGSASGVAGALTQAGAPAQAGSAGALSGGAASGGAANGGGSSAAGAGHGSEPSPANEGCSCSLPRTSDPPRGALVGLLFALAALRRRRGSSPAR